MIFDFILNMRMKKMFRPAIASLIPGPDEGRAKTVCPMVAIQTCEEIPLVTEHTRPCGPDGQG